MSVYQQISEVVITVNGEDVSENVIWRECSFQAVAAAQPGTFALSLRDPNGQYAFRQGKSGIVVCEIDGVRMYQGYTLNVTHGYLFPDSAQRKWLLTGVDLNILFDKLIMYNHANPSYYPDGGGSYVREEVVENNVSYGWVIGVPQATSDQSYILAMLKDFDIPGGTNDPDGRPLIHCGANGSDHLISEISTINPDGKFTPPSAGTTLRGFMTDVSTNILRQKPGSTIWYINADGFLVYRAVDTERAPHVVGDSAADAGWDVRDLQVTIDVSHIKNDVLVFTGLLDPTPTSSQSFLRFRHNALSESIQRFGRFQYSEVLSHAWLQGMVNARSVRLLFQEGGPSVSATFTIFRTGLRPGMLVTISSDVHTYRTFDPTFGEVVGPTIEVPIRAIEISFVQPNVVQYRVTCSYDTADPWGLLLALKRSPGRGITQPKFNVVDLRPGKKPGPPADGRTMQVDPMSFVKEYPQTAGGNRFKTRYAYIRNSLTVVTVDPEVGGRRLVSFPPDDETEEDETFTGTAGFRETDPENGEFFCDDRDVVRTGKCFVEYHVWKMLPGHT